MPYDTPDRCHKCLFTTNSSDALRDHYAEKHFMTFHCPVCSGLRWYPRDLGCHIVRDHLDVWEKMESHFEIPNKFLAFASGTHERLGAQSPLLHLSGDVVKLIYGLWNNTRRKWYDEQEITLWGCYRSNNSQVYLDDVQQKQLDFLQTRDMIRFLF